MGSTPWSPKEHSLPSATRPTGPDSGSVSRDGNVVRYAGLEPVSLNGGSPTIIFEGDIDGDDWVVENNAAAGRIQVRSITGDIETTDFPNPATALQIDLGAGDNTLAITPLDPGFSGPHQRHGPWR